MNREPLFECDGGCECTFHEEDLRVSGERVLCCDCWDNQLWPEIPNDEIEFSDLPPFKSQHLTRNQKK